MYRIDERILEEYFYHGTENLQELLEGIVFFATHEMHNLYKTLGDEFETPNDIQLSKIREFAYKYGIQYYRFIGINQKPNKYIHYATYNEKENVKDLMNTIIEDAITQKSLIEYNVGYYFEGSIDDKFSRTHIKNNVKRRFWAIEVAEQLKQLSIQEKEDNIQYYKNWIQTKLNIAINRTQNRDQSEIDFARKIMQQLQERINRLESKSNNKARE